MMGPVRQMDDSAGELQYNTTMKHIKASLFTMPIHNEHCSAVGGVILIADGLAVYGIEPGPVLQLIQTFQHTCLFTNPSEYM